MAATACSVIAVREEKNPWVGVNYFNLNSKMAVPPPYWLARLHDFDADLVVFPSFMMPYAYVLARRARKSRGIDGAKAIIDTCGQPDTVACLQNGLVPVTMIIRNGGGWSIDNILASLKARDTWQFKDGDECADFIEAEEAKDEARIKQENRDNIWNRAGDAWRSYLARTGASTIRYGARRESVTEAPTSSPSSSTVSAGFGRND